MFHCTLVTSCCSWSWCWICASCQPGVVPRRWPPQTGGTWRWFARWGCSLRPLRKAREINHRRQENPHLTVFSFFSLLDMLLFSSDKCLDAQNVTLCWDTVRAGIKEFDSRNISASLERYWRTSLGVGVNQTNCRNLFWTDNLRKTVQMKKKRRLRRFLIDGAASTDRSSMAACSHLCWGFFIYFVAFCSVSDAKSNSVNAENSLTRTDKCGKYINCSSSPCNNGFSFL